MKIKFFKGIRKYHDTERCLGFSLVYDRAVDITTQPNYVFGLTLYLELMLWQVWFELDFVK
jgi:hypothetical protein